MKGKASRPLTYEEKIELEKIYRVGEFSSTQIGDAYNRPFGMISHYIKQVGGYIRGLRNFTDEQESDIALRYISGESACGIARSFGLDKVSILAALRRQGVEQRSPSDRNRLYAVDEYAFDTITPDAAYWWGFLYADGGISRRSLVLSLKWSDIEHVEKFKKFIKSESPIKKYSHKIGGKSYPACYLGVTSQHLVDRLRCLGIVPHRTNFDAVKDNLQPEMICHWIRGFFDGDGTIYVNQNKRFNTGFMGSKEVVEWIRECIPFIDKNKRIRKHSISNVFYLSFSGNNASREITNYLYGGQTLYMERKRELSLSIPDRHIHERDKLGRFKN